MPFLDYLHQAANGGILTPEDSEQAVTEILEGRATPAQIGAWLVALRMRGETADELLGCARAMRAKVIRVDAGTPLLDTCGTGGDGSGTFNVSTVAAIVAAGAGARVAKHGNRSISSQCGSADILEALGVKISLTAQQMGECIRQTGIGFLFAPALHPAMKHVQPVRLELKMRTVFNLLGPLANPAGANAQLVGAPSLQAARLMADVLAALGLERGFVVHGSDGMDEVTTTGETSVFEVRAGKVIARTVTPEDFGVKRARIEELAGGDRDSNAAIARAIFSGERGPKRDIVLVNAAVALVAYGHAADFSAGMEQAAAAVDLGAAKQKWERFAEFTQAAAGQSR